MKPDNILFRFPNRITRDYISIHLGDLGSGVSNNSNLYLSSIPPPQYKKLVIKPH